MVLIFYNLALLTVLVAGAPWWLWRMATTQKYREGLGERLGRVPHWLRSADGKPVIWLHAVSVGEVLAVSRLVQEIEAAFPGYRLCISTTTRTGQELARTRFGAARVFYCPLDLPWAVRAYLNALRPRMLILAETEFWPNLLNGCFRRRYPGGRGQRPHLRPLVAALPDAAESLAADSRAPPACAGAIDHRRRAAHRAWLRADVRERVGESEIRRAGGTGGRGNKCSEDSGNRYAGSCCRQHA